MQGKRPAGNFSIEALFNSDPTEPNYLGNFQASVGSGSIGSGAVYDSGFSTVASNAYYSHPPAVDDRFVASGPYNGVSAGGQTGRIGCGLIGEVATQTRNLGNAVPATGTTQLVAKLRGSGPSNSHPGQLALPIRDQPSVLPPLQYGQQQYGRPGPAIGQYSGNFSSTQNAPRHSSSTSSLGSTAYASTARAAGAPIGQMPVSSYQSQKVHDPREVLPPEPLATVPSWHYSPFVPASTSQPITGIVGRYSMPGSHAGSHPAERLTSKSVSDGVSNPGSISNLGSLSNLGSISQMGSLGVPIVPGPLSTHSGSTSALRSGPPSKVKAVCSSGGHFVKLAAGSIQYQGGETRLIAIPNYCSLSDLTEALERLGGSGMLSSASSEQQNPSIKYQLPTEPNVYVDLIDDEDTKLMFDEWQDYCSSAHKLTSAKLHLFVDWQRRQMAIDASLMKGDELLEETESVEELHSQERAQELNEEDANSGQQYVARPASSSTEATATKSQYMDISKRLEVISQKDVSLTKFLGSGGYGEVYFGKWNSSEAAIKCLNPSLFFNEGQVTQAAIDDLMREADILGSLRHPNVVWVFGVVLPSVTGKDSESSGDSEDLDVDLKPRGSKKLAAVRPPAIVTEFMSRGSLKGALQRKDTIVNGALLRIMIAMDAAKGMEHLHSKRIVHFDLKSANLLLGLKDGRAICKVADFGLSKQQNNTYVSDVSSQRGTLPWIAPEIIKSPHAVTEKVDVYSFGVVLWELWTGREPFDGLNYHALLHQITTGDAVVRPALPGSPDWDPEFGPEPAPGYRALVERCWADSPAGRPAFTDIVKVLKGMANALRPSKRPKAPPTQATSQQLAKDASTLTQAGRPSKEQEISLTSQPAVAPLGQPQEPKKEAEPSMQDAARELAEGGCQDAEKSCSPFQGTAAHSTHEAENDEEAPAGDASPAANRPAISAFTQFAKSPVEEEQ